VVENYRGPSHGYVGAVDGTNVRHLNAATGSGETHQSTPATATTTQTVPAGASNVSTFSTTFTVTRNPRASKLLHCIVNAQGDVDKVLKCQQRFPP
jgi:hypothetical protein